MNIFLSWSGELSQKIAEVLKDWIPTVLQSAKPYFTPSDIEKGSKWESEITKKLNECNIGIICITKENTEKPWILFEAGALSSKLEKSRVCPLLFGVNNADLTGPLATFQTTSFDKKEFKELLIMVNNQLGESKISEIVFEEVFNTFFPKLEEKINSLLLKFQNKGKIDVSEKTIRTERELLEEILELTRLQYTHHGSIKNGFDIPSDSDLNFIRQKTLNCIMNSDFKIKGNSTEDVEEVFNRLMQTPGIPLRSKTPEILRKIISEFINY